VIDLRDAEVQQGWTFVAEPAPVVPAAAIVAAFRSAPLVAWSSRDLTLVGVGVAHELRGRGDARWQELVAGARQIDAGNSRSRALGEPGTIRPRLLGGLAFVPGAANAAPWTGFGDAWFALPRWSYIREGTSAHLVLALDTQSARHDWREELAAFRAAFASGFQPRPQPPMTALDRGDTQGFRAEVRAITRAIDRGEHAKVVAARSAVVSLAGEVRAADMLAELDARHAECVRVLVRPPGGGTLIAATPERLVKLDGLAVQCDALAGSHALSEGPADSPSSGARALLASGKDRREHALVVDAITSALRGLGADVRVPDAPVVRALRHMLHLHTPITATLPGPRHVLELAAALHPTPAVGGTPTRVATRWIADHEVPRGWYASPVGWCDLDGNGELAVAIRSGVLAGERAHLWAGAGIVAGSDPDRELAETELKLRAMLGALGVAA
jgi:menaquinone-specific isochorismate synthase